MKILSSSLATAFCFVSMSITANASVTCPWSKPNELLAIDSARSLPEKKLSRDDVLQDLDCFKLIATQYIYDYPNPPTLLLGRLASLHAEEREFSASELADELFELHDGMPDFHFGYQIGEQILELQNSGKKEVALSQQLESKKIIPVVTKNAPATYYRPEDFFGDLTQDQSQFIRRVSNTDSNFIVDLRGNGGGDDKFAFELAKVLFTRSEKIPQAKSFQAASLFVYAGLLNTVRALDYRGMEDFQQQVIEALGSVNVFSDLLLSEFEEDSETLVGNRKKPFTGKMILLIDGGCASSCETVVEKLMNHPRVTLVGQNTFGALHFSNPAMYQLPNSGIFVRIPTLRHIYENDAPEGVGYVPDVFAETVDLVNLSLE
jgi:hypothetical protein